METNRDPLDRPRVLLADDHKMVAEGLRSLLAAQFELVDLVENGLALVEAATRLGPDVIVADIAMPGLSGLEALATLRQGNPAVKMIFLTMHRDAAYVHRARELGAAGFVLKTSAPEELISAIHAALDGRTFFSPAVAAETAGNNDDTASAESAGHSLTPRQEQILRLISDGYSAKEIAKKLAISSRTVEFHKYQIMKSHGLQSSAELIHLAIRRGLSSV